MEERVEVMDKQQAKALKEAQRLAKEREREEHRAKRAENLAKKEQARAEREALKHEKEAQKEKKRLAKEEAERKRNAVIQKQAGIMNKLFVKEKPPAPLERSPVKEAPKENVVMSAMDRVLATIHTETNEVEVFRRHFDEWRTSRRQKKFVTWGLRREPKVDVLKQPKLQRDVDVSNEISPTALPSGTPCMKLLQFHKCFRPAYYGTHSKKSNVIGPRHPLRKEPSLDYTVDSDDEWEEEEPGENLSDLDEPEEEEKVDDDDSADDFVVPDGYFSADEGVDMDTCENQNSCSSSQAPNTENVKNILDSVAERALKHNCPFVLRNFTANPTSQDSDSVSPYRDSCLKALEIRVLAEDISIEPVTEEYEAYPQEVKTPITGVRRRRKRELADSALPEIVRFLRESSTLGMKKIVESLSQRFPGIPKSTLTSKVREISTYTDNHWKVKDEVLALLQPQKKKSLDDEEKKDDQPVACINVMQKRCLPNNDEPNNDEPNNEPNDDA
ncbi:chromatin assembly factor 1 subunit FSM [Selaginella moellendorffii]|uniref:chromatin assembly factor 1 subunit FSM n=1 Tax=Selaginella moellendorffii TaxID=88036 RepID=UPI000D1CC945|nr:chromatin assembly factor 1 subunit FSM [Selaginella moellendorffii]|eukprot:XP_024518376.1 chromatin assembly factor 1 subunit FSM [Selaginella moellendorffii]